MKNTAGDAAAVYAAMRAAAGVGDFWLQTSHQAAHKADAGWKGRMVVARHAASYAATQAVALVAADKLLGMGLKPSRIAAAVAISGITHAVIDRRWPVRKLADVTGKRGFHDMGGPLGGAFHLDQSAHHLMEAVAAVIAARGTK